MPLFRSRRKDDTRKEVALQPVERATQFWPAYAGINALDNPWITAQDVTGIPAAWRCLNLISNSIALMSPPRCYDGKDEIEAPIVLVKPSPDQDCFDWYHSAVATLVLDGNFYALPLERDDQGVPGQLLAVPRGAVNCHYNDAGKVVYDIGDVSVGSGDILHIRAFTMPGNPVGIGVVDAFRRNLAHLIDQQNAASGSMTGVPSGIIKIKTKEVSQTQADLTKSQWLEVFAKGVRAPAVLGENMDFTPISFNAQESQFIESRQMGIAETAFMFGLDPADVAASVGGQSLTYANLDSRNIDRITNSFGGWIRRIEEGLSSLLPGNQAAKLPVEKLLRTETKNRYEAYGLALTGGWMTVDEVRALENLAPLQVAAA